MQRLQERDPRAAGSPRVGLFIDYEGVRRGLDEPSPGGDAGEMAQRLRDLAGEQGRVLVACAYADWSSARAQARDFRRHHIEPRLVLGREGGDDRTDLVMSLDVLEALFLGPDIDVFVLVTGESPCHELVSRLRRADRGVVLVGFDPGSASPRGQDRFVPLEDLLGVKRSVRGRPAAARRVDFSAFDWAPFIRLMDELEQTMPFVGFGWLLKKKLSPENSGCYTMQEKQELMDRASEEGILVLYKVDNIEERADPVTACKLNRDHPRVRELVSGP